MAFNTKIELNNFKLYQSAGESLNLSGNTSFSTTANLTYNVHPTFTGDTQIVDKKYVDDQIATGTTNLGAANGLTVVGDNVELGGTVTKNTCVSLPIVGTGATTAINIGDSTRAEANIYIENGDNGSVEFVEGDNGILVDATGVTIASCIQGAVYAGDYEANFVDRSLVTKQYVDGQTSGITGTVTCVAALSITSTGTDITSSVANPTTTPVITLCIPTASASNRGALSSTDWSTFNAKTSCLGTVTGANNGLSSTSTTVSLGGAIINDTCISGAYLLGMNMTTVNITGSTVNLGGTVTLKTTPNAGSGDVLTYNASTGAIEKTTLSTLGGVTGGTNGLGVTGQNVCLGGTLAAATTISGTESLTLGNLNGINLRTANACNIEINGQSNGGVIIKSQSGTILGNDFTNAVGILADFNGGFIVYDNRATPHGICYDSDYSAGFVDRSLVDKQYVDSIATGLDAHAAVVAATTSADGDIPLTGLTTTIDGITPSNGDRILVKNQTDGTENGIYIATGSTWYRSSDYDFNPSGEVGNGDLIPVTSGNTQAASVWILVTPNPIVSGTTELVYSQFSQQLGIVSGDGVDISTVGAKQQISVVLSPSTSGLCFDGGNLELDYLNIVGSGLTNSGGAISVNANQTPIAGSEIPVHFGAGCALVVDSSDFSYTSASDGLTKHGCNVTLGGALTGDSVITICTDTSLKFTDNRVGSLVTGLEYTGDYSSTFTDNSLITKKYVDTSVAVATGGTAALTGLNGITRTGDVFKLGGTVTGDTTVALPIGGSGTTVSLNIGDSTLNEANIYIENGDNGSLSISEGLNAVQIDATGVTIASSIQGAVYAACYHDVYVNRSLVDKEYVDISVGVATGGTAALTGLNGITRTGDVFKLGGTVTGDTCITLPNVGTGATTTISIGDPTLDEANIYIENGDNGSLSLSEGLSGVLIDGSGVTISSCVCGAVYAGDYEANFVNRSLVTKQYVDTSVGVATGGTAALDGTNGITRTGDNFGLGGVLTTTTNITGAQTLNLNINALNITGATTIGSTLTLTSVATGSVATDNVMVITSGGEVKEIAANTLGENNNIYSKTIVTTGTTLTTGSTYLILVNHTAPVTITLPATPIDGQTFKIKDASSGGALTNNITINPNGNNIDRASGNATINTDGGSFELSYDNTLGWFILSFVN